MSKRVCAEPDCGAILSRYNGQDTCNLHGGGPRPFDYLLLSTARAALDEGWWKDRAACRDSDIRVFDVDVPSDGSMTGPVLAAKRVCAACPVRRQCLDYSFRMAALEFSVTGDPKIAPQDGKFHDIVYGGLTGRERMRLHDEPDRVERGMTLLDTQRLLWWLDPLFRDEEEDAA